MAMLGSWLKEGDKISKYFTVKEALWLPQWKRIATPADGLTAQVEVNLEDLFTRLDKVRVYFGRPIVVHVAYRPVPYNKLVDGALASMHLQGKAVDFHVKDVTCDEVRARILPWLSVWGFRCENLPGASWVHLDTRPCKNEFRFFKP